MGLKVKLADGERMIVNGALIRASGRVTMELQNRAVILRGKELMDPAEATTPARKLYYATMMAYIDEADRSTHQDRIVQGLRDLLADGPPIALAALCVSLAQKLACQDYYLALLDCRELITLEDALAQQA